MLWHLLLLSMLLQKDVQVIVYIIVDVRCDKTLDDEDLPSSERWEGCSPDMDFSINFAKSFVDRRVDNATLQYQKFVLHNNRVGQLVSI